MSIARTEETQRERERERERDRRNEGRKAGKEMVNRTQGTRKRESLPVAVICAFFPPPPAASASHPADPSLFIYVTLAQS